LFSHIANYLRRLPFYGRHGAVSSGTTAPADDSEHDGTAFEMADGARRPIGLVQCLALRDCRPGGRLAVPADGLVVSGSEAVTDVGEKVVRQGEG